MQPTKFSKIFHLTFAGVLLLLSFPFVIAPVQAGGEFSGSNCANYHCPVLKEKDANGEYQPLYPEDGDCGEDGKVDEDGGNFYCNYSSNVTPGDTRKTLALPRPPQLRVIEYWIVRIIYGAWALAGIFFTLVLMWIGFNYITSFGNEVALADVIKKFRYWLIGLVLVFLSYPILNTFFAILPIDTSQDCYGELEEGLIGFRFFFPTACGTDSSAAFNNTVASCIPICEDIIGGIGLPAPVSCSAVCTSLVVTCLNRCERDPVSGNPTDNCANSCIRQGADSAEDDN